MMSVMLSQLYQLLSCSIEANVSETNNSSCDSLRKRA